MTLMASEGRPRPFRFSLLLPTLVALVASLMMHGAIPIAALAIPVKKAQSRAEIELIRTPPSENPVEPETETPDSDKKETEDAEKTVVPQKKAPEKKAPPAKKPPPKKMPPKKSAKDATDGQDIDDADLPPAKVDPKAKGGRIVKATAAELAKAFRARARAEREAKRAAIRAERARERDERDAARREEIRKNGIGGIPPGDPRALFACDADTRGDQVHLRAERAVNDWVAIVPTVLLPFETRPSLGDYIDQTTQVVKRARSGVRRVGGVEMAIPQEVLQLPLDMPPGGRLAVGHLDGRCLIGFSYTRGSKDLFPITLTRVPIRMMFGKKTSRALVDFTMNRDATFSVKLHDKVDADKQGELLFKFGRLKNGVGIQNTISSHINAAKTLSEVASWFGVDVKKMSQEGRKERLKDSVKTVSKEAPRAPKKAEKATRSRSSKSNDRARRRRRR